MTLRPANRDRFCVTDADIFRARKRFWRMPVAYFRARDAIGRNLWEIRGLGSVVSLLPALASLVYSDEIGNWEWTPAYPFTTDRLALYGGISKNCVGPTLKRMESLGLIQRGRAPKLRGSFPSHSIRVRSACYPIDRMEAGTRVASPHRLVPAVLFAGGVWRELRLASARHVLLAILCLDSVDSEDALRRTHEPTDDFEEGTRFLRSVRAKEPVGRFEIEQYSGVHGTTLDRALRVLREPVVPGGQSLLRWCREAGYWIDGEALRQSLTAAEQRALRDQRSARGREGLSAARRVFEADSEED